MKIHVLLASPDSLDYNLIDVMRVLNTTFDELGEKLNFIKLDQRNIPPLTNQYPVSDVANIVNQLANSDGIIFACTSNLFAPCGILQNFLDYLSLPMYNNFLKDKNCFTVVVSNEMGEAEATQYLTSVIQHFGGFTPVTTAINKQLASQFNTNKEVSEIFEKQVEDYYRILRQNRKFFRTHIEIAPVTQGFDVFNYNQATANPQTMPQQPQQQPNSAFMQPNHVINPMQQGYDVNGQQFNAVNVNGQFVDAQPQFNQQQNVYTNEPYTGVPNYQATQQIQENIDISQASSLKNRSYVPEPLQPQQNSNLDFSHIENKQDTSFLDNNYTNDFVNNNSLDYNQPMQNVSNNNSLDYNQPMQNIPKPQSNLGAQQPHNPPNSLNGMVAVNGIYEDMQLVNGVYEEIPQGTHYVEQNDMLTNQSVKQMTYALENKFLPQQSNGLVTDVQVNVSGAETFNIYLHINGNDCKVHDGASPAADVIITVGDEIWRDVLEGKITTQKAFMTGQLKVRGNFVLLPRIDSVFKFV